MGEIKNDNLKSYIDEFFDDLELYDDYNNGHNYKDLLKTGIDVFLDYESDYTANEIYQTFFMIYQITPEDKSHASSDKSKIISEPNTLLDLVKIMKKYEDNTGELIERQRDHFIHSVNVFLLGLAIYARNKNYRRIFKKYVKSSDYKKFYKTADGEMSNEEFLYRWGIASLFHDIGYPFEIIGKQLNKIISDSVKSISNNYDVDVGIDFKDFDEFNTIVKLQPYDFVDNYRSKNNRSKILDLYKPTEIMAHKITKDFNLSDDLFRELVKRLNSFVYYMKENNFIDHGFYSAILVLNSYGKLIQKHAKNNDFFFYPIVDSATAILLHNYYNKTLQKDPFNLELLAPESNPIAFLLILCDELQEWNRQPFGIIDKKKFHVNDLIIEIDDRRMDVEYILNNGSMGLGFSKDKEGFINEVLDLQTTVFDKGLTVVTKIRPDVEDSIMRDMDISEIQAPDVLIRNVEKLAIQTHEQYQNTIRAEYNKNKEQGIEIDESLQKSYDNLIPFKDLTPSLKLANIRQARSIPKKLNMIGCEIADKSDPRPAILKEDFLEKEVLNLAIYEHKEWCDEKIGTGWTFTSGKKDVENLKTPYLIPWEELSDSVKQLDIDTIYNIPNLLDSIGLKVVRTRLRLLTFKMHEFYMNGVLDSKDDGQEEFNKLEEHVQYSNYKQANFIVRILKERKYEIVPLDDKRPAINQFNIHDIEHFAKREHQGWYMLKINLGWSYGSGEGNTNPNLVSWDELSEDVKQKNRNTFINLPAMCADPNVGLKIVKSE
ncbi:RyR domain-containing protein [Methanobrevibacter sp.]|uniref:RyR domain-containing protein n=1 Tax=Methanobrevibacter sp. TaxID=66852 RepID=UPI00388D1E1E